MPSLRNEKGVIFCWGSLLIAASCFIFGYLAYFGNKDQVYRDILVGYTAFSQTNKSSEMYLLWGLLIVGSIVVVLIHHVTKKKQGIVQEAVEEKIWSDLIWRCSMVFFAGTVLFTSQFDWLFLAAFIVGAIAKYKKKEAADRYVVGFFFLYYALYGTVQGLGILLHLQFILPAYLLILGSCVYMLIALLFRLETYRRHFLVWQALLPLGLSAFLITRYQYQGATVHIGIPHAARVFLLLFMAAVVIRLAWRAHRLWHDTDTSFRIDSYIGAEACALLYGLHQFVLGGVILPSDLHHPFENIIGFSEIFEHGQLPFSSYIPVSGLYSVVHGALVYVFGNDTMAGYNVSSNIFCLLIACVSIYLLRPFFRASFLLIIALFFTILYYNRSLFLVPCLLLLLQPKLMEKPYRWFPTWLFVSWFMGLYYPVFGVAVSAGFFPYAVYLLIKQIHVRGFVEQKSRLIAWGGVFLLIAISLPLLAGQARHILAMAGQSLLTDGVAVYAQEVPKTFLQILYVWWLRAAFYDVLHFLGPALVVWVGVWLFCRAMHSRGKGEIPWLKVNLASTIVLFSAISYKYTFVIMDVDTLWARCTVVIMTVTVLFLVYLSYFQQSIRHLPWKVMAVVLLIVMSGWNPNGPQSRSVTPIYTYYPVPEHYTAVEGMPHIGYIFLAEKDKAAQEGAQKWLDPKYQGQTFFDIGQFGIYYLDNLPGAADMECTTVIGYPAARETMKYLVRNHAIIGTSTMYSNINYYYYHYLMTSGKYKYSPEDRAFHPAGETDTLEDVLAANRKVTDQDLDKPRMLYDLKGSASALGSSMSKLRPIFTEIKPSFQDIKDGEAHVISLDAALDGDTFDFLYVKIPVSTEDVSYIKFDDNVAWGASEALEADPMEKLLLAKKYSLGKHLRVMWVDESGKPYAMTMDLSKGELLVPLGAGEGWLLQRHKDIRFEILDDDGNALPFTMAGLQFLKLRPLEIGDE